MDAIFAILVLGAVIFFGALISVGNERQRKAIDGIREQAALWAMQDLRLKREKLAREVKVDDPLAWLNLVVAKVYGENLELTITEVLDNSQALVCMAGDGRQVMVTPLSPDDIRRLKKKRRSRLSQAGNLRFLLDMPANGEILEISMLNAGVFFDLELSMAWGALVGVMQKQVDTLFVYGL